MKKYIQNFEIYFSESIVSQEKGVEWLMSYQDQLNNKKHFDKYSVKPDYIATRHLYAPGVANLPAKESPLYIQEDTHQPTLDTRTEMAQEKVDEIFQYFYKDKDISEKPNHLNHVSCTHYQSPSAAQKLVVNKEWFNETIVTHLYHMGCYAALPAIRVSKAYVADGAKKVDIVHTELCSYHLDRFNVSAEQTIMNTLFADGAIKYSVTNEDYFKNSQEDGFEILAHKEIVVPNSEKEMSWKTGSHGFLMRLTRNVPIMLAKRIESFMIDIFAEAGLDYSRDKEKVIFAIHPGGPKIVELVERVLKLNQDQVKHSKFILNSRGNMSSATIPQIWNEIKDDKEVSDQTHIATVAFGPGLTMTGAVLKLCRH